MSNNIRKISLGILSITVAIIVLYVVQQIMVFLVAKLFFYVPALANLMMFITYSESFISAAYYMVPLFIGNLVCERISEPNINWNEATISNPANALFCVIAAIYTAYEGFIYYMKFGHDPFFAGIFVTIMCAGVGAKLSWKSKMTDKEKERISEGAP